MNNTEKAAIGCFGVALVIGGAYLGISYYEQQVASGRKVNHSVLPAQATMAPQVDLLVMPTTFINTPGVRRAEVTPPAPQEPCFYSDSINNLATPIPSGERTPYQHWLCNNGYWMLGWGDWIDNKGNWRKDGVKELGEIKYDENGKIMGWKFYTTDGVEITK